MIRLLALPIATLLLSACGSTPVPAGLTKAELRLTARLMMPLLSATTVQLAAHNFSRPLLPVSSTAGVRVQALDCNAANFAAAATDADQDRIPASASAQLGCAYTDDAGDSTSSINLNGTVTVVDKDDTKPDAGLTSTAQLSGTSQTSYKGATAALNTSLSTSAFLDPKPGTGGYSGGLTFVSESVGEGKAFGIGSGVTLRRALDAQLTLTPDADTLGGNLRITGTLNNRNDLSKRNTDLQLAGTLHARQGDCEAADSGSVNFSKGSVSVVATVTGCGVYSYQ